MRWLEKLQDVGTKAAQDALERNPPEAPAKHTRTPKAHQVTVSVCGASGNDPGEVAIGFSTFDGGSLTPVDEKGVPLGGPIQVLPEIDPRSIARSEMWKRWSENGRFNRRLEYPPTGPDSISRPRLRNFGFLGVRRTDETRHVLAFGSPSQRTGMRLSRNHGPRRRACNPRVGFPFQPKSTSTAEMALGCRAMLL